MSSDGLRDAAFALLGLALFSGLAQQRAESVLKRDLRKTLVGGMLRTRVEPSGAFGLLAGRSSITQITGSGIRADMLPLRIHSGRGPLAHIRKLEISLTDTSLRNLRLVRFKASLPNVDFDSNHAAFGGHIVIRRAGEGTAEAEVSEEALRSFLQAKFPMTKILEVRLTNGTAFVRAEVSVLGAVILAEATAKAVPREGRYLFLEEAVVKVNGRPVPEAFARNILRTLNPILDIDRDLGLGKSFTLEKVEIRDGTAVVFGRLRLVDPNEGLHL